MMHQTQEDADQVGKIAGLGAGIVTGASIGTAILPIPVIGTFAGALVGGLVGSQVGRTVGGALLDFFNTPPGERDAVSGSVVEQLERLNALKAQGAISPEEYETLKRRLF